MARPRMSDEERKHESMSLRLQPEEEAQLYAIAIYKGLDKSAVLHSQIAELAHQIRKADPETFEKNVKQRLAYLEKRRKERARKKKSS